MNVLNISWFLISIFSCGVASPAKEPNMTCNNYNQHTIIQSIAGKDGVKLQNVTIGRKQAKKNHGQEPDSNNADSDQNDSDQLSPTRVWTNENAQHITLNADQSKQTQLDPHKIIPDGIIPLTEQSPQPTPFAHAPLNLLAMIIQPKVIIGTIGIAYASFFGYLLYTSQVTLAKNGTWASWRQEIPNNLLEKAEATIAKDLYTDIQAHYANEQDTAAFLTPLLHFVNDVNAQIHELTRFIKLHETLTYYKIALLFPAQQEALTQAAEKIKRLEILKQFAVKSISQYKVT